MQHPKLSSRNRVFFISFIRTKDAEILGCSTYCLQDGCYGIMFMFKERRVGKKKDHVLCVFLSAWKWEVFSEAPLPPFQQTLLTPHRTNHTSIPFSWELRKTSTIYHTHTEVQCTTVKYIYRRKTHTWLQYHKTVLHIANVLLAYIPVQQTEYQKLSESKFLLSHHCEPTFLSLYGCP